MRVQLLMNKVAQSISDRGVMSTVALAVGHMLSKPKPDAFDTKRGTDTGEIISLWKLKIDSPRASDGIHYQTSPAEAIIDALCCIGGDTSRATFVDLGCGKGRPMIIASELGFRRVIGVEFAPELVAIANRNFRCLGLSAIAYCGDAAEFKFPKEPMVVFLFHPFGPDVLAKVIDNLRGHAVRIVYMNPKYADVIDRADFLAPIDTRQLGLKMWKSVDEQPKRKT
jgi:predicted RNA methylase